MAGLGRQPLDDLRPLQGAKPPPDVSPAVFAPQEGKALTASYLSAALKVLGSSLRYVSQWNDHASAVLEFEADLDGVYLQGVDILRWNGEAKLVSFTVMVHPMPGCKSCSS